MSSAKWIALWILSITALSLISNLIGISNPVSADNQTNLFISDNFSNSKSGWIITDSDIAKLAYGNGIYEMTIKNSEWGYRAWREEMTNLSDFIVEADFTCIKSVNQYEWCGFRLAYAPYLYEYFFRVLPWDQVVYLNSREKTDISNVYRSTGALLLPKSFACVKSGKETNRIRLVVSGKNIKAYINGTQVVDTYDNALPDLKRLAGNEGGTISLSISRWYGAGDTIFQVDNFKLYRGVNTIILAPSEFMNSPFFTNQEKLLANEGFEIINTKFFEVIDATLKEQLQKMMSSNPVLINVICDPSDKDRISKFLPDEYTGEVRYIQVSYISIDPKPLIADKSVYYGGDTIYLTTDINNTGLLDVSDGTVQTQISNSDNKTIFSGKTPILQSLSGDKHTLNSTAKLPLFCFPGEYKAILDINAIAEASGNKYSNSGKLEVPVLVSGPPTYVIIVASVVLVLVIGIVAPILILRKRQKSAVTRN